jgi:hypothetical protein
MMDYQYDTSNSTITIHKDWRVYITQRKRCENYKAGTTFHVIAWMDGSARVVAPGGLLGIIALRGPQ